MEDVAIELERLREAINKQNELQETANAIMQALNESLRSVAQELLEARERANFA